MKFISFIFLFIFFLFINWGTIAQVAQKDVDAFLNDTAVRTGHAGISIYEPATGKYLYNYNADKNFIPSSNVKLFTLYAGMKYLGDSLPGMRFTEDSEHILLSPTGDPTLLHPDFKSQRVFDFLRKTNKQLITGNIFFQSSPYGKGWAWDDFTEEYMAERSVLPVFGNIINLKGPKQNWKYFVQTAGFELSLAPYDRHLWKPNYEREFHTNSFTLMRVMNEKVPFITSLELAYQLLSDTIHRKIATRDSKIPSDLREKGKKYIIHSRPVDSLFRPMMFESDNFFAEQTLLMVSNERLGFMSDEKIIDTIIKNDFKDIPNKPRWVDGSGLSRYNLFSPKTFIYILEKLQKEFGMERMKRILPTAGQGTLTNYYDGAAGYIYAKTGSMRNNVALSGYLYTKKNKLLLFSVLLNNYSGSGREGRRAIEKFIRRIMETN